MTAKEVRWRALQAETVDESTQGDFLGAISSTAEAEPTTALSYQSPGSVDVIANACRGS